MKNMPEETKSENDYFSFDTKEVPKQNVPVEPDIPKESAGSKKKRTSYSQYSNFIKCEYRWKLDYLEGKRVYEDSINTCFGTVMHETIQEYIKILYTKDVKSADEMNLKKMFRELFLKEMTDKKMDTSSDDYTDFVYDGEDIIDAFCTSSTRMKHFPSKKYEFVGVELEIDMPIKNNVSFVAYIDLVLKDKTTGKYKIYDFKTSTQGWNSYQKEDETKYSQILLYKAFYSKKYKVPLENIEVEFFILKRKLIENVSFPQSRIQKFVPTSRKSDIAHVLNRFSDFIDKGFTPNGEYNKNSVFYKNPGKAKKNCKYCPHKKVNCDAKSDMPEDEEI